MGWHRRSNVSNGEDVAGNTLNVSTGYPATSSLTLNPTAGGATSSVAYSPTSTANFLGTGESIRSMSAVPISLLGWIGEVHQSIDSGRGIARLVTREGAEIVRELPE